MAHSAARSRAVFSTPPLVFKDGADWHVTTALTTAVTDFNTVNRSMIRENNRRQPSPHFCSSLAVGNDTQLNWRQNSFSLRRRVFPSLPEPGNSTLKVSDKEPNRLQISV